MNHIQHRVYYLQVLKTRKSLKLVGSRPGVMYGSCKVHKANIENCLPFRPILPTLNTPTYKFAKFLGLILKPLRTNKFTRKYSFHFGSRLGVMYGSWKVHKASIENCLPLRPILSAFNTPTYNLAKFLGLILKPLRTNKFTIKYYLHFAEEIIDQ